VSAILGLAWKVEQALGLLTAQGLSTRAIQKGLIALDMGIRRQKITDYVRLIRGAPDRAAAVKAAVGSGTFSADSITEMVLSKKVNYRIFGRQYVENVHTGETMWRNASMFTNERKDPLDYEGDYLDQNEEDPSDPEWIVIGFEATDVFHNRGYEY